MDNLPEELLNMIGLFLLTYEDKLALKLTSKNFYNIIGKVSIIKIKLDKIFQNKNYHKTLKCCVNVKYDSNSYRNHHGRAYLGETKLYYPNKCCVQRYIPYCYECTINLVEYGYIKNDKGSSLIIGISWINNKKTKTYL
jgi:hypothetical protein